MGIDVVHNIITFILRKQKGVYISPQEIDLILNKAQLEVLEYYFKSYGETQIIHDALTNFKVLNYQFTSDGGGNVQYNSNYIHLLAGVFTVTGSTVNKVRFVETDELPDALTAQIRKVSLSSPIATESSNGFRLYPQSIQTGFYSYLKVPPVPVYGYTQIGRVVVFDPTTSTNLDWIDVYQNKIIAKALAYYGINMDEDKVVNFSMVEDKENS
jgi:hypothetical protein